jgi:hypothetical protein
MRPLHGMILCSVVLLLETDGFPGPPVAQVATVPGTKKLSKFFGAVICLLTAPQASVRVMAEGRQAIRRFVTAVTGPETLEEEEEQRGCFSSATIL